MATLPNAYARIAISDLNSVIGGGMSLGNYYMGGNNVRDGIYIPYGEGDNFPWTSPTRGPISLHNFHNAELPRWYGGWRAYYYWQAGIGWWVEYYNNRLSVVLATVSNYFHTWGDALIYPTSASLAAAGGAGWSQVCRVNLDVQNQIYFNTNATLLQNGGMFDSETINAYFPSGWTLAARYNGGNSVTIYCNQESHYSTGDDGTNITLGNIKQSFALIAGTYQYISGYKTVNKVQTPIYATALNSSYTYNFR